MAGTSALVHLVGPFDEPVPAYLEASGYVVDRGDGEDAGARAVGLADQTYGAPAGTDRRVLVVADDDSAWAAAAAAAVYGVNVGVPVVPLGSGPFETDVPLREVVVVAPASALPDDRFAGLPDDPFVTRIWDDDPVQLAFQLADLLGEEPRDGDLQGPDVVAPIAVDISAGASAPALLAATVASQRALAGMQAPLLFSDGAVPSDPAAACAAGGAPTACRLAEADGPVTVLALTSTSNPSPTPTPDSGPAAPLPTTGGGVAALAGALVLLAAGRRRAAR